MTPDEQEEELAPYLLEGARSSRSKCKGCRRAIDKGTLRLGVRIEGPFGQGYLWFHLTCAAKRRLEDVEEAYKARAWAEGLEVPPLEELRKLQEQAEKKKTEKREVPFVDRAPTGRAKCKQCEEPIAKDSLRVTVLRQVEFYNQVRSGPVLVHPACVGASLAREDDGTGAEDFAERLRANSANLADADEALAQIGDV